MRPIRPGPDSVNHRSPSGPVVISSGALLEVGRGYSLICPLLVIRPILLATVSTNHSAPSGPRVSSCGLLMRSGNGKLGDLTTGGDAPDLIGLALREPQIAIESYLISPGKLLAVGIVYSVTVPGLVAARDLPAFRLSTPTSMNARKLSLIHTFQRRDVCIVIVLSEKQPLFHVILSESEK